MRDLRLLAASHLIGSTADDVVTACILHRADIAPSRPEAFARADEVAQGALAELAAPADLFTRRRLTTPVSAVWPDVAETGDMARLLRLASALLRRAAAGTLDGARLIVLQTLAETISADTLAAAAGPRCGHQRLAYAG